jgi:hypothetical protein
VNDDRIVEFAVMSAAAYRWKRHPTNRIGLAGWGPIAADRDEASGFEYAVFRRGNEIVGDHSFFY